MNTIREIINLYFSNESLDMLNLLDKISGISSIVIFMLALVIAFLTMLIAGEIFIQKIDNTSLKCTRKLDVH